MVVTLTCTGDDASRDLAVRCTDKRFIERHDTDIVRIDGRYVYVVLLGMADWVNNELNEEFLIEVA